MQMTQMLTLGGERKKVANDVKQMRSAGGGGTCGAGRAEEALNEDGFQPRVSLRTDASAMGGGGEEGV